MSPENEEKTNAIRKALQILLLFMPENRPMGNTEISRLTGFNKATVSRILHTLVQDRFLQQDTQTKAYSLGQSILNLALSLERSLKTNLVQIAKPFMDRLCDEINETINLEVLSGHVTVSAYVKESTRPVRVSLSVGASNPLHAAAGAKAILAFSPPEKWTASFRKGVKPLTTSTITNEGAFREELERVRLRGYSTDFEEYIPGICAVGAPIFNHEGNPVAAVDVVGPPDRITGEPDSELVRRLKETAEAISRALHHEPRADSALTRVPSGNQSSPRPKGGSSGRAARKASPAGIRGN